jgi:hypothetical protein
MLCTVARMNGTPFPSNGWPCVAVAVRAGAANQAQSVG